MNRPALTILGETLVDAALERMHDVDAEAKDLEATAALDAIKELIRVAKATRASLQHLRGPMSIIHARTAELDAALRVIEGGVP